MGVLVGRCGSLREEHANENEGLSSLPEAGPAVTYLLFQKMVYDQHDSVMT